PVSAPEIAPEGDDATVLTWAADRSVGNAELSNGGGWYVDHAHPEYSAPAVTPAGEAVDADRAGGLIARRAMEILQGAHGIPDVAVYKNNTDGNGASYGPHENFLLDRDIPFDQVARTMIPFLASRQVLVGAGRVGIGTRGDQPG